MGTEAELILHGMMTLMTSSINMVNGARKYGGIGSVTGNPVLTINNYNCRDF